MVYKRIIAIGDIHGCYYSLVDLFKEIDIDFNHDFLILLGDYIDRGKYSILTVQAIRDIIKKHPYNVIALMGNHEQMCVNS